MIEGDEVHERRTTWLKGEAASSWSSIQLRLPQLAQEMLRAQTLKAHILWANKITPIWAGKSALFGKEKFCAAKQREQSKQTEGKEALSIWMTQLKGKLTKANCCICLLAKKWKNIGNFCFQLQLFTDLLSQILPHHLQAHLIDDSILSIPLKLSVVAASFSATATAAASLIFGCLFGRQSLSRGQRESATGQRLATR